MKNGESNFNSITSMQFQMKSTSTKRNQAISTKSNASYLHTIRGVHPGCRREDIHGSSTGDRVRRFGKGCLRLYFLDNHVVLMVGYGFVQLKNLIIRDIIPPL